MNDPWDIVAGEDVLYVSVCENGLIHRIQLGLSKEIMLHWSVSRLSTTRLKLSISKKGNVIVASWYSYSIFEYTSFGILVRQIALNQLDKNIIYLFHAIQLEGDKFLVCHSTETTSRVCVISNTGRVIKSYGGHKGSEWDS